MTATDPPARPSRAKRHPLSRLTIGQRLALLTGLAGAVLAIAAAIGARGGLALATLAGFVAIGIIGLVPGELSGARRSGADERHRLMEFEAMAWSGFVLRPVILIGAAIELYRGTPGPFVLIGAIGSLNARVGSSTSPLPTSRRRYNRRR
ncbi:MAG TPA: hypothetical protein VMZ22_14245 [Acidimicrobiales bacterium]|nr:hypothetical protein [Acidimicrobiales bacterium]